MANQKQHPLDLSGELKAHHQRLCASGAYLLDVIEGYQELYTKVQCRYTWCPQVQKEQYTNEASVHFTSKAIRYIWDRKVYLEGESALIHNIREHWVIQCLKTTHYSTMYIYKHCHDYIFVLFTIEFRTDVYPYTLCASINHKAGSLPWQLIAHTLE